MVEHNVMLFIAAFVGSLIGYGVCWLNGQATKEPEPWPEPPPILPQSDNPTTAENLRKRRR